MSAPGLAFTLYSALQQYRYLATTTIALAMCTSSYNELSSTFIAAEQRVLTN